MISLFCKAWLLSALLAAAPLAAQETPPGEPPAQETTDVVVDDDPVAASETSSQSTLRTLLEARQVRENALTALRETFEATDDPTERVNLQKAIDDEKEAIADIELRFEAIAAGVDVQAINDAAGGSFDLQGELESLLEPLVQKLKSATAGPRQIEQLRTQRDLFRQKLVQADGAITSLEELIEATTEGELQTELDNALAAWRARRKLAETELDYAKHELARQEGARQPLLDSAGSVINDFFRSKGMNLLFAIATFAGVFITLRFIQRRFVEPLRVRRGLSFYARLTNVLFNILVFVAALAAMILVLFSVSDWILLVIVLIFLFGIGWASVNMLPQFFEQIRILLNLGSVRENERVIYEGLPWRVDSLRLYTVLRNPTLTGGVLRIPVQDLSSMRSRPYGPEETWFPCDEDDWVRLDDGIRGRVISQTPDMVDLALPGGGKKAYQTQSFLALNPQNISRGYRARVVFGIDYDHQAISTTEVPPIMEAAVRAGLAKTVDPKSIVRVIVDFREAGASSLDYEIQADMTGAAAARYEDVHRALARILVDTCNEHGWVIPFTQVTLHNAPSD